MKPGLSFFDWISQLDENARRIMVKQGLKQASPDTQVPTAEDFTQGDLVRFSLESGKAYPALVTGVKGNTTVTAFDPINNRPIEFKINLMRQQPDSLLGPQERMMRSRAGGSKFWHAYASEAQMKRHETGKAKAQRDIEAWLRSAGTQTPDETPRSSALDDLLASRSNSGSDSSGQNPQWAA